MARHVRRIQAALRKTREQTPSSHQTLDLSEQRISRPELKDALRRTGLRTVDLEGAEGVGQSVLQELSKSAEIEELNLAAAGVRKLDLSPLSQLVKLRRLDLTNNIIRRSDLERIAAPVLGGTQPRRNDDYGRARRLLVGDDAAQEVDAGLAGYGRRTRLPQSINQTRTFGPLFGTDYWRRAASVDAA